jgi:uncharacterized SAM-binding protein YcdF (DUF218 family)
MRICVFGLFAAALGMVALIAAGDAPGKAAAKWLDVGEPLSEVDYVVILPGDANTRPFAAAAMIKAGYAATAVTTTVKPSVDVRAGVVPAHHEMVRMALIQRGVSAGDIVILPSESSTTFDDVRALAAFLKQHPAARVALVTNDFHTRRARWITRQVLGEQSRQIRMVAAPSELFRPENWWRSAVGFKTITSEYAKLLFYHLRYGRQWIWVLASVLCIAASLACFRARRRAALRRSLAAVSSS